MDVSEETESVARKLSVGMCSLEEIPEMDVVVFSVPIENTSEVIREVAPRAKSGALLTDLTSLKEFPVREMLNNSSEDVSVIGMHPLFGPFTPLKGQTVVLTPARHREEHLEFLEEVLEGEGVKTVLMSPEEHDKIMAIVQCLSHFSLVSFGVVLRKLGFKPLTHLIPPVYLIFFDLVGRILHQNPRMYEEIQKNPHAKEVRKAFIESVVELNKSVDESKFAELMKRASEHFEDTFHAFLRSEKLIKCKIEEIELLKSSINSEIVLRDLKTSEILKGRLLEVEENLLRLEVNGQTVTINLDEYEVIRRS
jgi:prephenate dehydrogenase